MNESNYQSHAQALHKFYAARQYCESWFYVDDYVFECLNGNHENGDYQHLLLIAVRDGIGIVSGTRIHVSIFADVYYEATFIYRRASR